MMTMVSSTPRNPNQNMGPSQYGRPSQLGLCRHPSDGILSVTGDHPRDSCSFGVNEPSQLEGRRCGDLNPVELYEVIVVCGDYQ